MSGDGVELLRNAKKRLRKGLELLRNAIPKLAGGDGIAAQGKKEAQEMLGRAAFGGLIGVVGVVGGCWGLPLFSAISFDFKDPLQGDKGNPLAGGFPLTPCTPYPFPAAWGRFG